MAGVSLQTEKKAKASLSCNGLKAFLSFFMFVKEESRMQKGADDQCGHYCAGGNGKSIQTAEGCGGESKQKRKYSGIL